MLVSSMVLGVLRLFLGFYDIEDFFDGGPS